MVAALLGGLGAAVVALMVAFGGDATAQPSWGPNDPDPPFGLFVAANARSDRAPDTPPGRANANPNANGNAKAKAGGAEKPSATAAAGPMAAAVAADANVAVGTTPTGLAINATRAYVANAGSNNVSVIDLSAVPPSVVATIPVGVQPVGVALSADDSQLYVTNYSAGTLSIISTASNTVTNTVTVGSRPNGVIRVGASVYVANLTGNSISVVNPATATVTSTVTLGGSPLIAPSGLAANSGGTRLYASDARNGKLLVLDLTASPPSVLSSSTTVGSYPAYIAVSGTTGYVSAPGSNSVSVVNLAVSPPTVTATVPVGTANYGIVAQPALGQVFATNSGSNNLTVINTGTNTAAGTFPTGTQPNAIALTPNGMTAVYSNQLSNTVSVVHVNQPPVNTVPGTQTVNANGTGSANSRTFVAANSNALSTQDSDAGSGLVQLTLSVGHGTLATTIGATPMNGASISTSSFDVATIAAGLANGVTYTPTTGYLGSDTLTMTLNDQGKDGIGKAQSDTDTVAITVQNTAPVVNNVSFTGAVGNTAFGVGLTPAQPSTNTTGTVLSGSIDANGDPVTAGPSSITSTNGGTVTMNSNGTFTYVSAPGYTGSDTFTFTVSDGKGGSTNGTATVAVAGRVWYANNALGVNGTGTSVSPFNTLANLRGAGDVDSSGDTIFLFTGSSNYAGGMPLESSQRLIGQPEPLVIGAQTLWAGSGTNPTITNSAGAGITLADDTVIRRVNVANTSLQGISGGAITNADIGPNLSITNSTGVGFALNGAASGTVTMAGNITHSSGSARSFFVQNRTGGTVTMSGSINDTGGGIFLNTNTGTTMNFTGGITSNASSAAFTAQGGGTVNVTGTNTLSNASGALLVTNTTIGASGLTFQSVACNGCTFGVQLSNTGSGNVTITGTGAADSAGIIQNVSGDGLSLTNFGGTFSMTQGKITTVSGRDVFVDGGAGQVNLTNTPITNTAGASVVVQNKSGGGVSITGAVNDSGTGISLTNNTGATIGFTGGLVSSTGANPAFTATGGGTVQVTGSANTITTTTGTALNVQNTTIGASNLNFRSISANGGSNGIVLVNTGSSGRLIVSGTGTTGTGGTIQNIGGADGATAGIGIRLDTTTNPSFSWMNLHDFGNFAILGNAVDGLTLANSVVNGVNGNNAAIDEASVAFTQLSGSVSITNTTVQGAIEDNFRVVNSSGTLNRITFDTVTIGANSTTDGNDGISLEATGGTFNVTVQNSTFTSAKGDIFQLNALGTVTSDLVFKNNTVSNNHPSIVGGGGGMTVAVGSSGDLTYDIDNNTFRGAKGTALVVNKAFGGTPGDGTASGKIRNNTIGVSGVANSGSSEGAGIFVGVLARGTHTTLIQGNTIYRYSQDGILVQAGGAAQSVTGVTHDATLNATVQGNTIAQPNAPSGGLAQNGLRLNAGTNSGGGNDNYNVCLAIGDPSDASRKNTMTGAEALGGATYRLQKRFDADVFMPGYTGAATDAGGTLNANMTTYLSPRTITGGTVTVNATASGSGGYTNTSGGANCPVPA